VYAEYYDDPQCESSKTTIEKSATSFGKVKLKINYRRFLLR
jgi:hypothetical protein